MTRPNLTAIVSRLHDAGIPPRLGRDLARSKLITVTVRSLIRRARAAWAM